MWCNVIGSKPACLSGYTDTRKRQKDRACCYQQLWIRRQVSPQDQLEKSFRFI